MGSTLVDATPDEALAAVVGYSTFNDLTSRRAQKLTSQWILGKNGDKSGPLGPMVPAAEVGDLRDGLRVQTRVNGETVQDGRTDQMVYTVGDTLSLISHTFTLRPGDLLATGTPSGVGYARTPPWLLQPGDVVEVEVERLGVLRNTVVGNDARHRAAGRPSRSRPMTGEFRQYLFPPDHPRLAEVRGLDAYAYREAARTPGTFTGDLVAGWTPLYRNEFRGITEDGTLRDGRAPARTGPTRRSRHRSPRWSPPRRDLLAALDDDEPRQASATRSMRWSGRPGPTRNSCSSTPGCAWNSSHGRGPRKAPGAGAASLSPEGYELAHGMMLINGFLGEVVGLETILNEFSYNIALYGEPDLHAPWGWQLYGHHCAVNCLVVDGRMVLSPVFLGAEPNEIDAGPHAGTESFTERIDLGTALMAALSDEQRRDGHGVRADGRPGDAARPGAPRRRAAPGRRVPGQPDDPVRGHPRRRHARGRAASSLMAIAEQFVAPAARRPAGSAAAGDPRTPAETWFSWIGGHQPGDVFYYRLQSPVIIAELDHHCGVFLDYDTPQAVPHPHRAAHPARQRLRPRLRPPVAGGRRRLSWAGLGVPWVAHNLRLLIAGPFALEPFLSKRPRAQ